MVCDMVCGMVLFSGVRAQASEVVAANSGFLRGSQQQALFEAAAADHQSAAIRSALLQLFCCRTGQWCGWST